MIPSECMVDGEAFVPRLGWPRQHGHLATKARDPLQNVEIDLTQIPKYVVPKIVGTVTKTLQRKGHAADWLGAIPVTGTNIVEACHRYLT